MTGFGSSKYEDDNYRIQIEIKSLNSKFFDLQIRLPKLLSSKEIELRAIVSKALQRGKLNIAIDIESKQPSTADSRYNKNLFLNLYKEIQSLAKEVDHSGNDIFMLALQQTELSGSVQLSEVPEDLYALVKEQLNHAIRKCMDFREQEGKALREELLGYNSKIMSLRLQIIELEKKRAERVREKLENGLAGLVEKDGIDKNRLEQELIYYLEKLDITEEIVRLESHTQYFIEVLEESNCGKKLGFLSQELGREINTIGSKANDAEMQKLVVLMKEELEKIKEQTLNIL